MTLHLTLLCFFFSLYLVQWDVPTLLSRVSTLFDSLDDSIRLIPSQPAGLLQRKKTLACNLVFSVAPYEDVNGKKERAELNRLMGAQRNGPTRLTQEFVPAHVKKHVAKLGGVAKEPGAKGKEAAREMKEAQMGDE
jgi:hypothetical protein